MNGVYILGVSRTQLVVLYIFHCYGPIQSSWLHRRAGLGCYTHTGVFSNVLFRKIIELFELRNMAKWLGWKESDLQKQICGSEDVSTKYFLNGIFATSSNYSRFFRAVPSCFRV